MWTVVGAGAVGALLLSGFSRGGESSQTAMALVMMLLLGAVVITMSAIAWMTMQQQRREQQMLESIEEMVQLQRWQEAAGLLQELLSRPTRTPAGRVQGLIYLASVLARYERFEDAMAVQTYLLEQVLLDQPTAYGLRLGRTMAMLRQDHLYDADRAIAELRRMPGSEHSGGLALIEIYRDVKTGHPSEAIAHFESKLPIIKQQLGHRTADAYMLVARAYDLLDRSTEAQDAFERATTLAALGDLVRKYPETRVLAEKYTAARRPSLEGMA